ncbi:MAG: ABC transporter permease [Bacteroidota bacterium]
MMIFRSVYTELYKLKRSPVLWLSILGSLLLPVVFTCRFLYIGDYIDLWEGQNSWHQLVIRNTRAFTGFLLPVGAILVCSLLAQIEFKNDNWKRVHTTPQSFSIIFLAKFSTLLLLTVVVYLSFMVGVLINGIIPNLVGAGTFPGDPLSLSFFWQEVLQSFISVLPIIGLQFLLSMRFKNFFISIGLGLTLFVCTMPLSRIDASFLSPYSYVLYYFDQKQRPYQELMAVLYFGLLFGLSYTIYIAKRDKS